MIRFLTILIIIFMCSYIYLDIARNGFEFSILLELWGEFTEFLSNIRDKFPD